MTFHILIAQKFQCHTWRTPWAEDSTVFLILRYQNRGCSLRTLPSYNWQCGEIKTLGRLYGQKISWCETRQRKGCKDNMQWDRCTQRKDWDWNSDMKEYQPASSPLSSASHMASIPGIKIATSVALSFKMPQASTLGHETFTVQRVKKSKVHKASQADLEPWKW